MTRRFTRATAGLLLLAACSTPPRSNPLPAELIGVAHLAQTEDARHFVDAPPEYWAEVLARNAAKFRAAGVDLSKREHHYLAISGGGANGAYGAGLLCGWTETGKRPEFVFVTGISTGALTAPFAFLGPKYDHVLKEMYTTVETKDLIRMRPVFRILYGDAAADVDGIRTKLEQYVTEAVVDEIGAEHRKGRRLYIGTTNLDAQRAIVWNIGAIAISPRADRYKLIRRIILASASIPGAFPPVLLEVTANGKTYDELHVDGGVTSQVFLYPPSTDWGKVLKTLGVPGTPQAFVIRNSRFRPDYAVVDRKIFQIAALSIDSLLRTQGIGDLYRIYNECRRDGIDFHLTAIPDDFEGKPEEPFDPAYMKELSEVGREAIRSGRAWSRVPPHYTEPE